MATGSLGVGEMTSTTSPAMPWRACRGRTGQSLGGATRPRRAGSRGPSLPPSSHEIVVYSLLATVRGWGIRTMLTDMTHPPFQCLGEGVLGEPDLVVSHGVRVEGVDLPAHKEDAPSRGSSGHPSSSSRRPAALWPPRPETTTNPPFLSLAEPQRPGDVPQALECREWDVQGDIHTPGLLVLDDLAGFSGSGLGSSGLILEKRTSPSMPRTGITRVRSALVLGEPEVYEFIWSVAVQYPRASMTSSEIPDPEIKVSI